MKKAKIILVTLALAVVGLAMTAGAAQKSTHPGCDPTCCACCDCCK